MGGQQRSISLIIRGSVCNTIHLEICQYKNVISLFHFPNIGFILEILFITAIDYQI